MRTIVISDLHVGAGPLDDCDPTLEAHLVDFVQDRLARSGPIELVINGDFLDFAQATPWQDPALRSESREGIPLCFTEDQSLTKLNNIGLEHVPVFRALSRFLEANANNTIVILPGNHDADFFWPAVRERFSRLVGGESHSKLHFHLQQVYRPPVSPGVWIEHGHQYDQCNVFEVDKQPRWSLEKPPILPGKDGQLRLLECVGTQFLNGFLNRLDQHYPFVDNVKPLSNFVNLFLISALHPEHGPLKAGVAAGYMLKFLAGMATNKRNFGNLLGLLNPAEENAVHPLLNHVRGMDLDAKEILRRILEEGGFSLGGRSMELFLERVDNADKCMDFLANNFHQLDLISERPSSLMGLGGGRGTLALGGGLMRNESAVLTGAAKQALCEDDVELVVMGHTHEIKICPQGLNYYNTGCWTRNYDFGRAELPSWTLLGSESQSFFPYCLNYVEIPAGRPEDSKLLTYV